MQQFRTAVDVVRIVALCTAVSFLWSLDGLLGRGGSARSERLPARNPDPGR